MYEADPIQLLSKVDYSRADTFGDRACALSRLISKGYKVPQGVVVSTKVFKRFLNIMPGAKRIDRLIDEVTPHNTDEVAKEIQETIIQSPIPMPLANTIAEKIMIMQDEMKSKSVVIRTSAHVEDSSRHFCSGRGVYFNLTNIREMISVIKNCWAAAYTGDVLRDLVLAGLPPDTVRIAVIIEEMMEAKTSGILSIKSDDVSPNDIQIRSNWGYHTASANLGSCCDQITIDKNGIGEPITTFTSYKDKITKIPPSSRHPVVVENDPNRKNELSLNTEQIETLIRLAKKVKRDFEIDYDIEFLFDESDSLWVLDAIPKSRSRGTQRIGKSVNATE
ncbi:MAG: hypothetical protein EAX86_01695 [Candidatus Heimdallarchaeota archaeon]|nr:hypothetical protein [Candidatus Heimdallarchaeota archaeon]